MKVSGFSFIKNALKYDYPIMEAILSILPICDEFVIAVGESDDDTLNYIQSIGSPKIKILKTVWDETLREGGRVLAEESNKAFRAIDEDSDWAFYIQGDEVFHEDDLLKIKNAMIQYKYDSQIDGLLFDHLNFYGSYDYYADSRHWQKKEVRVVRNNKDIYSYKDAMSFRQGKNRKLNVAYVDACIYHYGWVKKPKAMQQKQTEFQKLWHSDEWLAENASAAEEFDFTTADSVAPFTGSHPKVMHERIAQMNWQFSFNPSRARKESLRRRVLNKIYKSTGLHIGEFKNYLLLRK